MYAVTLRESLRSACWISRRLISRVPGAAVRSPKRNTLVVLVYLVVLSILVALCL